MTLNRIDSETLTLKRVGPELRVCIRGRLYLSYRAWDTLPSLFAVPPYSPCLASEPDVSPGGRALPLGNASQYRAAPVDRLS